MIEPSVEARQAFLFARDEALRGIEIQPRPLGIVVSRPKYRVRGVRHGQQRRAYELDRCPS